MTTVAVQLVLPAMPACLPRRCDVCGGTWRGYRSKAVDKTLFTYVAWRQQWVKIGKTNDVRIRLRDLRAPNRQQYIVCPPDMDRAAPLLLLAQFDGDVEHELHDRWRHLHAAGEWFGTDDLLVGWLRRVSGLAEGTVL